MVGTIKTIMVVDSELEIIESIKKYVEHEDVEIVTACNNRDALEKISDTQGDRFDLVLINTQYPDKKSTALFSLTPSAKEGLDNDVNYLQKPFSKEQFIEFIKTKINQI